MNRERVYLRSISSGFARLRNQFHRDGKKKKENFSLGKINAFTVISPEKSTFNTVAYCTKSLTKPVRMTAALQYLLSGDLLFKK